jgi:segregation and condensation protein B
MQPSRSDERELADAADGSSPESDGQDEQVSLERLTEAFAELLGSADATTAGEPPKSESAVTPDTAEPDEDSAPLLVRPAEEAETTRTRDAPACPVTPRMILEAMLFVGDPANRPLSPRRAAARLRGVSPREIEAIVDELNETYRLDGCPYTIESSGEGYRMALREEFASVRERFHGRIREARLSQAAIDVLAMVAYHQPITRNRVDEVRGKPSGGILSQLVRRQLLRIERTDSKPRVTRYYTTDRFLDLFGLENLDDLPRTQDVDQPDNLFS